VGGAQVCVWCVWCVGVALCCVVRACVHVREEEKVEEAGARFLALAHCAKK